MVKKQNVIVLSTCDYKILQTVFLLNSEHKYPLPEGIGKILKGANDEEVVAFINYPTYKTLISYSSKKISRLILMLVRYNFLEKIYDKNTNELYLKITPLGVDNLKKYLKKAHHNFKKRTQVKKPTIVEIV